MDGSMWRKELGGGEEMWMGEVETLTKLIYLQFWSHLSAVETSMAGLRVRISIFDTRDCTHACGHKSRSVSAPVGFNIRGHADICYPALCKTHIKPVSIQLPHLL